MLGVEKEEITLMSDNPRQPLIRCPNSGMLLYDTSVIHDCDTCKHRNTNSDEWPCRDCESLHRGEQGIQMSKWEIVDER